METEVELYRGHKAICSFIKKHTTPSFPKFFKKHLHMISDWSLSAHASRYPAELFDIWKQRFIDEMSDLKPTIIINSIHYDADLWVSVKLLMDKSVLIQKLQQQHQQQPNQVEGVQVQQQVQQHQHHDLQQQDLRLDLQQQDLRLNLQNINNRFDDVNNCYKIIFNIGMNLFKNKRFSDSELTTIHSIGRALQSQPNTITTILYKDAILKMEAANPLQQGNDIKLKLSKIVNLLDVEVCDLMRSNLTGEEWSRLSKHQQLPPGLSGNNPQLLRQLLRVESNDVITESELSDEVDAELNNTPDKTSQRYIMLKMLQSLLESLGCWRKSNRRSEYPFCRRFCNMLDILFKDTSLSPEDGEQVSEATSDDIRESLQEYQSSSYSNSDVQLSNNGRKIDIIMMNSSNNIELCCNEWKKTGTSDAMNTHQQSKNLRTNSSILMKIIKWTDNHQEVVYGMDWVGQMGYFFSVVKPDDYFVVNHAADMIHPTEIHGFALLYGTINSLFSWKIYLVKQNHSCQVGKLRKSQDNVRRTLVSSSLSLSLSSSSSSSSSNIINSNSNNSINSNSSNSTRIITSSSSSSSSSNNFIMYSPKLSSRKRSRTMSSNNNNH